VREATEDLRLEEPASPRPGGGLAALGVWAFGCFSYWAVEVTAVLISSKNTFWVAAR